MIPAEDRTVVFPESVWREIQKEVKNEKKRVALPDLVTEKSLVQRIVRVWCGRRAAGK